LLLLFGSGCTVLASGALRHDMRLLCQSLAIGIVTAVLVCFVRRLSGAHFNPAVTVGFAVANRFPVRDLVPYIVAQVGGAIAGVSLLYYMASGRQGFGPDLATFGANGYGVHSPGRYGWQAAFTVEALLTFAFVLIRLLLRSDKRNRISEPIVIGIALALASLVAIPVSNASMNPARSTGLALVVGDWALDQLWLFWAAPLAGGLLAGLLHPVLARRLHDTSPPQERAST
jgi:aquaporin Z